MLILGCKELKADTCSLLLKVNGSVFHAIIRSFNSQPYDLELTFTVPLFIGCEYHKKTNKQTNTQKQKQDTCQFYNQSMYYLSARNIRADT